MKRLLVIAQHFAPSAKVAAQRPLRLVRRITDFGWEPYVLTMPVKCQQSVDLSLGADVLSTAKISTVPCWSIWLHSQEWMKRRRGVPRAWAAVQRGLAKLTYPFVPVDAGYPWVLGANKTGVSLVSRHGIDLIWATSPPLSSLCLARRISQRTGVPYVVDFRDVQRADDLKSMSSRDRRNIDVERAVLRDAASVIYVSPPHLNVLTQKHPFIADTPTCLIYNWFEAAEAENCPPRPFVRPTIVHGGFLYRGRRRLDGFLEALSILRESGSCQAKKIQFRHHDTQNESLYLTRMIAKYDLADVMQVCPSLPRPAFMSACRGSDILLVVVGHNEVGTKLSAMEHAGAIPGKLYDYFATCRPILVIGPNGCEAGKLVRRLNRGLAIPDDNPGQIADAIERLLRGEGDSGRLDLTLEGVREFEASFTVKKLAQFLSKASDG